MRQRVNDYAEFMCRVDGLTGTSAEAKEKAIVAFHERMVAFEHQLGRIQEELRLDEGWSSTEGSSHRSSVMGAGRCVLDNGDAGPCTRGEVAGSDAPVLFNGSP